MVIPSFRRPSQESITRDRLHEMHKILVQEGAELSDIFDETLDEERALNLQRKDRSIFCLITIESHPYRKVQGSTLSTNRQNEAPDYDTLVYLASGMPVRLSHTVYLTSDTLPEIEQIQGNRFKQGLVKEEFEYLRDYRVNSGSVKEFSFIVPMPEGTSDKQMVVYQSDSAGTHWHQIEHSGKTAIGKTKALVIPVKNSGIYRIGYSSRTRAHPYIITLPKDYGVLGASVIRKDGIEIPVHRAMGANSLAFQLMNEPSQYTLNLKLLQSDGRIVIRDALELKTCLEDKENDSSLSGNASLRAIQGFSPPDCRYRISAELLQNNLVNR